MGRKTFESFPKPLPNRTHVVITRNKNYNPEGCIVVDSIEKAIAICPEDEASFIIGGGEIYNLGLPFADQLEITKVHHSFDADAFFPELNPNDWKEIQDDGQRSQRGRIGHAGHRTDDAGSRASLADLPDAGQVRGV